MAKFRAENPAYTGPVTADMVTASGSGLDPHLSPESADAQAARVAAARGIGVEKVHALIALAYEATPHCFVSQGLHQGQAGL